MINTLILRVTEMTHLLLALVAKEGDTVIDATAGKGRDTCFLAALVKQSGQVWSFDVQKGACLATQSALISQGLEAQVKVICDDHANIGSYDIGPVSAAVFNLGWLPGGDHDVVSLPESTVAALTAVFAKLRPGGAIVIAVYTGHAQGGLELQAIQEWYRAFPAREAEVMEITYPAKDNAPRIIVVEKQ